MQNYLQPGDHITIAASPSAVKSGDGVVVGNLFGVASGDAEAGAEVVLATVGVFRLIKLLADGFVVGAAVYFDAGACTSVNTHKRIGVAIAPAGANASTTVEVRLSGDW